jgi:hypothetical protein
MNERALEELKQAYTEYLSTLSIGSLRSVGRHVGVNQSTLKKKGALVKDIVEILIGNVPPAAKTNRGAPVKDAYIDPKIFSKLDEIKFLYLSGITEDDTEANIPEAAEKQEVADNVIDFRSPEYEPQQGYFEQEVYTGQLETINGVSSLFPLNGRDASVEKIIVTVSEIKKHDLRDGDIVVCHAEKRHAALVATEILSVNSLPVGEDKRSRFELSEVCYPDQRISFYLEKSNSSALKYIDWLIPLGKGQRGVVTSSPKAGKTMLLKEVAKAVSEEHPDIRLLVLLTEQSPEAVGEFKKIVPKADFIYTTYDDESETHVFAADFLLKRAKRFAEMGMDVLMLVDSLTALAHAYNETEESSGGKTLSCGLESKTLHYIKKFFGSARCLAQGGSLAILGTLSVDTGNPMDDILAGELLGAANSEIRLSDMLVAKNVFPAIDVAHSQTKRSDLLLTPEELKCETFIRNRYLSTFEAEDLAQLIEKSTSSAQLYKIASSAVKEK